MKSVLKKTVCAAASALLLVMAAPFAASADAQLQVALRVEGVDGNIYYETINVSDSDGDITAADALVFADKQSDKLEIKGAETGYITEVNGETAGKFGGYDGWYYSVNGEVPSVGVNDYKLSENDSLTLYYGGFPCQIPYAVTDKLESDGVIAFKSNDVEYDENWNAKNVTNPVTDASVTVGSETFTTDKNGEIKLDLDKLSGELSVQIDKKDASGAPAVLRFAPDFTVTLGSTDSDSDTAESDPDKTTDSDTKTTDSDKPSDTDSDKEASSSSSSSSSQTASTASAVKSSTTTTTASAATASVSASSAAPAATGDGRTYIALAVFGVAAVVITVMLLLKKKSE